MVQPSVSIVTVAQGSRCAFLTLQHENVRNQTYPNIIEWVIVDGSKSQEESDALQAVMPQTCGATGATPVKYIPWTGKQNIGAYRNISNDNCSGDIVVCMDDDDYYMSTYVAHAVHTLQHSPKNAQVAGCSNVFVYDLRWQIFAQSKVHHSDHTVNNCIAYTKQYHQTHRYDESVPHAEEGSFLRDAKVEQMDPHQCLVHMVHGDNTFNKTRLVLSLLYDTEHGLRKTTVQVRDLMPDERVKQYEAAQSPMPVCPFDIVYYCGLYSVDWDPRSTTLGGSEQAVVQLAQQWACAGRKVAVYADFANMAIDGLVLDGVQYFSSMRFNPHQLFNTLILWRLYGTTPILRSAARLQARRVFVDFHDNLKVHYSIVSQHRTKYDQLCLMFKSEYHKSCYENATGDILPEGSWCVQMNGIQVDVFASPQAVTHRDPFRLCYTSSYFRGLSFLLKSLWPLILEREPRAELHVYYGLNPHNQESVLNHPQYQTLKDLLATSKSVCDHDRQPLQLVAREKQRANLHMYISTSIEEIDCISVRESLVAGCLPVLLKTGVFVERDGVFLEGNAKLTEIADYIVKLMRNESECERLRTQLRASPTIQTWQHVGQEWLRLFE